MHIKLILSLLLSLSNAANYTQYWSYSQSQCTGQPLYISSLPYGQCSILGTQSGTCTAFGPGSVYQSQKTTCQSDALSMDGVVQLFVTSYSYTSSTCDGDPSMVEAVMADANCHPASTKDGVVTSWLSVNCNGGRPIYRTCKDSGCSNCDQVRYDGTCQTLGAGASKKVTCWYPPGWKGTSGNGGIDGGDDANGARTESISVILALTSMLAFLQFFQ